MTEHNNVDGTFQVMKGEEIHGMIVESISGGGATTRQTKTIYHPGQVLMRESRIPTITDIIAEQEVKKVITDDITSDQPGVTLKNIIAHLIDIHVAVHSRPRPPGPPSAQDIDVQHLPGNKQ